MPIYNNRVHLARRHTFPKSLAMRATTRTRTHRLTVVVSPLRPKRDYLASPSSTLIISSFSLSLLLFRFERHSCRVMYICIYIFFSLLLPIPPSLRVPHRASSSFLYSFTVSQPVRPPLFSLPLSAVVSPVLSYAASRAVYSFVRFTLDHSYFLSRSSAAIPSSAARSRSFLPPIPSLASARRTVRSPFPPRALRLFLQSPASVLYVRGYAAASAEGRGQKHAARPC